MCGDQSKIYPGEATDLQGKRIMKTSNNIEICQYSTYILRTYHVSDTVFWGFHGKQIIKFPTLMDISNLGCRVGGLENRKQIGKQVGYFI